MDEARNNLKTLSDQFGDTVSNRGGLLDRLLSRRYKLILFSGLLGMVIALGYILIAPDNYNVCSRIFVDRTSPKLIDAKKEKMADSRNFLYAQAEIIQSMPILSSILSDNELVNSMKSVGINDPLKYLREKIAVNVGKGDDIITVSGYSTQPLWLTNVINSMVDAYILHNGMMNSSTSSEVISVMQKEKHANESELKIKREKLFELARSNGAITLEEGDNIELVRLARISDALTVAELELTEIQTLYDTVNGLVGNPEQIKVMALADSAYSDAEEQRLRNEIQVLEKQLAEIQQEATGQHPVVYTIFEKKALLNRQLQDNTSRIAREYRESIIQRWVACSKKVQQQRKKLEEQKAIAWNTNSEAAEYEFLKKEIERLDEINDTLDRRIKEENLSVNSNSMNITILERADVRSSIVKQAVLKSIFIGLVAGLWFGALIGLFLELNNNNVHSEQDVNLATRLQILGTVPNMSVREGIRRLGVKSQIEAASEAAESFREIWSHLYYQGKKHGKTVVMVTSPAPGEGKSVVASNIAITMAHSGIKVLLVDADFRSPVQQKIHDSKLYRRYGLSTVLEHGIKALPECIEATTINGLDLLSSGPGGSLHSDLLAGATFSDVLEVLKRSYDRIIIDTPPVLAVADARIMAGACDSTIMVVRADQSGREQCAITADVLRSVGADITGVVINDISAGKKRYGYIAKSYGRNSSIIEAINNKISGKGERIH